MIGGKSFPLCVLVTPKCVSCAYAESFVRGGPHLITFILFLVDGGIEVPHTAINRPPSARQRNAIEMAFCWLAGAGPTLNAGLVAL